MSNTESISARLRRLADKGKYPFTFEASCKEFGVDETPDWDDLRNVFRDIADEIDREMDELRGQFANPRYMSIEDVVREVALGIDDHGSTKAAIERWYNPKPIDTAGKPVDLGQSVDDKVRGELEVSRVCYTKNGFYFNESKPGGANSRPRKIVYDYGERVKRPKQMLDADGVPIEVGDVLYRTTDGMRVTVARLKEWYFVDDESCALTPSYFTHREPDTQERIDEDALKSTCKYFGSSEKPCCECSYEGNDCFVGMRLDLLRRQRELDGRDA